MIIDGNGKKYYSNGKLRFEGKYLNNKRNMGKAYDTNRKLINELNI